jgi:hypothetical protein
MLAAASYLGHSAAFCIFAILATVFAVSLSHALAAAMCAFFVICHLNTLLSDLINQR